MRIDFACADLATATIYLAGVGINIKAGIASGCFCTGAPHQIAAAPAITGICMEADNTIS